MKVIHFNNGSGGGVLSVIRNLIEYSQNPNLYNHVVFAIEKKLKLEIGRFPKAKSIRFFEYNKNWNFYYTCKRLRRLVPSDKAVLVAHDWLELGMISHLGMKNPVVFFLHGDYDYYYDLAAKHDSSIDKFIVVADNMREKLIRRLPARKSDIHYLRFPVADAVSVQAMKNDGFHIVFVGRNISDKGFDRLSTIARNLKNWDIAACWHIIGERQENLWNPDDWQDINVRHHGQLINDDVRELLSRMHCVILPSLAEGMPVSIIEAMKVGVVPIVNDIEGGVQELVLDGKTGFKILDNDPTMFSTTLKTLAQNKTLLTQLSLGAVGHANKLFPVEKNTHAIEQLFIQASYQAYSKKPFKVYGSRLDKKWMPNWIVSTIRRIWKVINFARD